jgi:hypothetical protein
LRQERSPRSASDGLASIRLETSEQSHFGCEAYKYLRYSAFRQFTQHSLRAAEQALKRTDILFPQNQRINKGVNRSFLRERCYESSRHKIPRFFGNPCI